MTKTFPFGTPGSIRTESFTQSLWDGNGRAFLIVVPDEAAAARPVGLWVYTAMTSERIPAELYEELTGLRDERAETLESCHTVFCKSAVEPAV